MVALQEGFGIKPSPLNPCPGSCFQIHVWSLIYTIMAIDAKCDGKRLLRLYKLIGSKPEEHVCTKYPFTKTTQE